MACLRTQIQASTVRHAAGVIALLTCASGVTAQEPKSIVVADAPSCARCTIDVRRVATLGANDGAGTIPGMIQALAVDSSGRYWLLARQDPPRLFSASGAFIGLAGRRGSGPGEFQYPMDVMPVAGDSILVIDGGRAILFDANLNVGRHVAMTQGFTTLRVIRWPTLAVGSAFVGTGTGRGKSLHEVSLAGPVARFGSSFGPDESETGAPTPFLLQRVEPARADSFWTADWARYRLTLWSAPARRVLSIERNPSWFPRSARGTLGSPSSPPDPGISAIHMDSGGMLWVFSKVPRSTWREAWPRDARGEMNVSRIAQELLYTTIVEVIDPVARRVVARSAMPNYVVAVVRGPIAAAYTVDESGIPRVALLALRIVER